MSLTLFNTFFYNPLTISSAFVDDMTTATSQSTVDPFGSPSIGAGCFPPSQPPPLGGRSPLPPSDPLLRGSLSCESEVIVADPPLIPGGC